MSEQLSTPRRSVALAAMFLVLATVAFGAAFYLLNGAAYVAPLVSRASTVVAGLFAAEEPATPAAAPVAQPVSLDLPDGMSEQFALRLWQEQVDSQSTIQRLVNGEISSLRIDRIEKDGDEAVLHVTVRFSDDVSTPGRIGLIRFEDSWYVSYASAERNGVVAEPSSAVPDVGDVDVPLLNTIIGEQHKSSDVTEEYVNGIVKEVFVGDINRGPSTATLSLEMDETHGDGYARLVAIRQEIDGEPLWFLARFAKTGEADTKAP